jgi:acyl-CoA thioester hydrolase
VGRVFTHRIRVRYGECDPQGVVFNANYFGYFDIALTELWRASLGGYAAMIEAGTDMVVAEAGARFVAPARFDDELELELRVARLGSTSMTTRIDVRRGGELLVEGELRHVFVEPATGAKKPMPDDVRRGLDPYAAEAEAAAPA